MADDAQVKYDQMITLAAFKAKEHIERLEGEKAVASKKYEDQLKLEKEAFAKSSLAQKAVFESAELARKEREKNQKNEHNLSMTQR